MAGNNYKYGIAISLLQTVCLDRKVLTFHVT